MTDWNLETNTVDEFDPSAPLLGKEAEPPSAPDSSSMPDIPDDDGVTDESGSATVWVSDDGSLIMVRISNRWRERAKTPLADRVMEALRQAQPIELTNPLPFSPPVEVNTVWRDPRDMPLDATIEAIRQLVERREKLDTSEISPPSWTGTVGEGLSSNQQVRVVLDRDRHTASLEINEEWVRTARAEQIGEAILTAHQEAYANHEEGSYEPNEYTRIAQEMERVVHELYAPGGMTAR